MQIGLIDVDSHNFPNLCLMKISACHKGKGDSVEWWNGLKHYDIVYKSRVFDDTYTREIDYCINAEQVVTGGTGYGLDNKLPDEIEHQFPDYDLYGIKNRAFGHLTRGCPRGCPFCIVKAKEGGQSNTVAELVEFWDGQSEIVLLDPNITASKDCQRHFDELIKSKANINFSQGLDVRFMTEDLAEQLNRMRTKMIHFAWDNYEFKTYEKLKRIRPLINKRDREIRVYVLTNFNTTTGQDLERVYKLRELGYDPFVMIYNKPKAPAITKRLARWCNNKFVFRSCERFDDYGGTK